MSVIPLLLAGLVTMNSFTADSYYFDRQLVWIGISLAIFLLLVLLIGAFASQWSSNSYLFGGTGFAFGSGDRWSSDEKRRKLVVFWWGINSTGGIYEVGCYYNFG